MGIAVTKQSDPVAVRAARPTDLDQVLRLARGAGLLEAGIGDAFGGFFVAEKDGVVIGACGVERHSSDGLLRTVVVDADCRHQGIGRRLVEAALLHAREQRLRGVYLLTVTAPAFFTKLGFAVSARAAAPRAIRDSWEFRTGCPSSATLMFRSG